MNALDRSWWRLQWAELVAWVADWRHDDADLVTPHTRRLWARKE